MLTPSSCFSSPRVKFNSSSAFLSSTVPFVSVCEISKPQVYTATFAFVAFLTIPAGDQLTLDSVSQYGTAEMKPHPLVPGQKPCPARPYSRSTRHREL